MSDPCPPSAGALVLAGARQTGDPLCQSEGVSSKAILDIDGKPMISHVFQALKDAGFGSSIWVLGGDRTDLKTALADHVFAHIDATGAGPAASLHAALSGPVGPPLLVTTADHPLLSADIVTHFLQAAQTSGADLCIGLAQRATIEDRFPHVKRTYLPIGEGDLSTCNLFYLSSDAALRVLALWQTVEAERKHPWRMARRLGLMFLLRLFLARRSQDRVFELLSMRLGARIAPVILPFAEAAVDVDTPDDLALVREIFSSAR